MCYLLDFPNKIKTPCNVQVPQNFVIRRVIFERLLQLLLYELIFLFNNL